MKEEDCSGDSALLSELWRKTDPESTRMEKSREIKPS